MDLIDKKILCSLDMNCREPFSKIAKKLRTNRNVIAYRVEKLEKQKMITGYITSINLGGLGYKTYKIYLKIGNNKLESEFVKKVTDDKAVMHFLKLEGSYDYSITVVVKNISELDSFLMKLKNRFKEIIRDYTISMVVYSRIFKLNKILLNEKINVLKYEKYSGEEQDMKIDENDIKILKILSQNANMPIIKISENTGLSLDIVKYRLKKMSHSLINSNRIIIDMNKLGYYRAIIMLKIRKANKNEEEKLATWCSLNNNVMICSKRIGSFDFEINAVIKNIDELNKFVSELKEKLGEIVDSCEVLINTKSLKLNYFPF